MNRLIHSSHPLSLALTLLVLLSVAAPSMPAQGAQPTPQQIVPAAAETEPNNLFSAATPISFTGNNATMTGTIDDLPANDAGGQFGDWYSFVAPAGATVAITLTNLPADYDVALVANPLAQTLPVSDGLDLSNIADWSQINSIGQVKAIGQ